MKELLGLICIGWGFILRDSNQGIQMVKQQGHAFMHYFQEAQPQRVKTYNQDVKITTPIKRNKGPIADSKKKLITLLASEMIEE